MEQQQLLRTFAPENEYFLVDMKTFPAYLLKKTSFQKSKKSNISRKSQIFL